MLWQGGPVSALRKRRERDAAKVADVRKRSIDALTGRTKTGAKRKAGGGQRPDQERLIEVERLFLQLKSTAAIKAAIVAKFKVDERTVYNDLARVRAEYAPTDDERKARRDQHRATLVRMLEVAEGVFDLELARKIAADLAKLDGLNEPDKVEHSGGVTVATMTSGGVRARIAELLDKARGLAPDQEPSETRAALEPAPTPIAAADLEAG